MVEHDSVRAYALCANIHAGEIVIFDKAYVDFAHWVDLARCDVFRVICAKDKLQYRVVRIIQDGVGSTTFARRPDRTNRPGHQQLSGQPPWRPGSGRSGRRTSSEGSLVNNFFERLPNCPRITIRLCYWL